MAKTMSEVSREHYLKNREAILARQKARRAEIAAKNREKYRTDPEYRARIARNSQNWRRKNRPAANAIVQRHRDKKRAWLMDQKRGKSCEFCGEADPCCLDWHHMDPSQKEFTVSHMWSHSIRREVVEREIAKCILICANCHRRLHRGDVWQTE